MSNNNKIIETFGDWHLTETGIALGDGFASWNADSLKDGLVYIGYTEAEERGTIKISLNGFKEVFEAAEKRFGFTAPKTKEQKRELEQSHFEYVLEAMEGMDLMMLSDLKQHIENMGL